MQKKVNTAFELEVAFVELANILPVKQLPKQIRKTRKYRQIAASIQDVGIIEPPVVARERNGTFLLLDGHLRVEVLKELDVAGVACLVATDDEAFTYNKRINRLATIQEHKMVLKAIKNGVPEARIAKALDVNISTIREKWRLLEGLCPEAVELLKDKHCSITTFRSLVKMKPMRQVEVVQIMIDMDNYTVSYAKAMLATTPQDQLVDTGKPKSFKGVSAEQIARMETEMAKLQRDMKLIEDSYGPDYLNLVLARGYLASLIGNNKVLRYLMKNHGGILAEFQKISEVVSMGSEGIG